MAILKNKYPTVKFVFDRKHTATATKRGVVQIEIYHNYQRKWITTSVKLYSNQWSDTKHVVNMRECVQLNTLLDAEMSRINEYILGLSKQNKAFDFDKFLDFMKTKNVDCSFLDFVRERVLTRSDIKETTRRVHCKIFRELEVFGKLSYISELTPKNIMLFADHVSKKGLKQTTHHGYMKLLKTYIHEAIRFGILDNDPTIGLHFDKGKAERRRYLTQVELDLVKRCKINQDSVARARDVFLFQCYTGLAYSDLAKFDFAHDVEKRNGKYIIMDRRRKTNEDYFIVLLSPAVAILEKYDFKLPIIANQKYNAVLKIIALYAGLDKRITTHVARHTFAVFALNSGVPIEVVAKMLGHSDIRTTQVYAKILSSEVERGFDLLEKMV